MTNHWRRVLAILDGTPTGMRGQSLAELSLTLPIFLIMLVGLVEIGWFANNYLILTDVVRAAGRYGSTQDYSLWKEGDEKYFHRLDCDITGEFAGPQDGANTFNLLPLETKTNPPTMPAGDFSVGVETTELGFYDGVACTAVANMAPLVFDEEKDDIVISVISYTVVRNCGSGICIRLAGRYPAGRNECPSDGYDPFDIDKDGVIDSFEETGKFDPSSNERYRGYTLRANLVPTKDTACIGSEFDVEWLEEQLNKTLLKDDDSTATNVEAQFFPSYGMVLVEIQWNSHQLLSLPFFTWVANPIRIHAWGMFPLSSAEPDLDCMSTGLTELCERTGR